MARQTSRTILAEWANDISAVPSSKNDFVCECCLGPVTSFQQCSGCNEVINVGRAPTSLRDRIVPMTSALNPSRWYTALASYKGGFQPDLGLVLASVAHHFLLSRAAHIRTALGGEVDIITPVPSKRGVPFERQPLRLALGRIEPIESRLQHTLNYDQTVTVARRSYAPNAFRAGPAPVAGARVLLIEDSWVSGATAVSAAGALLNSGAATVLLCPIARIIPIGFWPADHPYRTAMRVPWDPDSSDWPRPTI